jgi:hypothetical protein
MYGLKRFGKKSHDLIPATDDVWHNAQASESRAWVDA